GQISGPLTHSADGTTTGTVVVDHARGDGRNLILTVTQVSASDPLDDLHLYTPGYGTNPTRMFTDVLRHHLHPFSTIRTMNWTVPNNSTETPWQTRTQPGSFPATRPTAVPWEDIIELGNEAHKGLWINVPALATSDYIQTLAQLVATRLDPGLNVYLE